jgi:hypothetical protein
MIIEGLENIDNKVEENGDTTYSVALAKEYNQNINNFPKILHNSKIYQKNSLRTNLIYYRMYF